MQPLALLSGIIRGLVFFLAFGSLMDVQNPKRQGLYSHLDVSPIAAP